MSNIYMFFMKYLRMIRKKYKEKKYNYDMNYRYTRYKTFDKKRYFYRYEPDDYIFVVHTY